MAYATGLHSDAMDDTMDGSLDCICKGISSRSSISYWNQTLGCESKGRK